MARIKNTGTHAVDVADGRNVGPDEFLPDVDVDVPHNKDLVDQGLITVTQSDDSGAAWSEPEEDD